MEHELNDSRSISQVDEDQAAVIPPAVDPARDAGIRVRALGGQLPAPAVAVRIWPRCALHD
jgi:hypothetical protein